jgi:hypothetical protein
MYVLKIFFKVGHVIIIVLKINHILKKNLLNYKYIFEKKNRGVSCPPPPKSGSPLATTQWTHNKMT